MPCCVAAAPGACSMSAHGNAITWDADMIAAAIAANKQGFGHRGICKKVGVSNKALIRMLRVEGIKLERGKHIHKPRPVAFQPRDSLGRFATSRKFEIGQVWTAGQQRREIIGTYETKWVRFNDEKGQRLIVCRRTLRQWAVKNAAVLETAWRQAA